MKDWIKREIMRLKIMWSREPDVEEKRDRAALGLLRALEEVAKAWDVEADEVYKQVIPIINQVTEPKKFELPEPFLTKEDSLKALGLNLSMTDKKPSEY